MSRTLSILHKISDLGMECPSCQQIKEGLPAWPSLTDEMMDYLEAGLGEFAWGTASSVAYGWDNPDL